MRNRRNKNILSHERQKSSRIYTNNMYIWHWIIICICIYIYISCIYNIPCYITSEPASDTIKIFTKITKTFSHHMVSVDSLSLPWRHYELNGVSNRRRCDCLLNCLFRHWSNKTSQLCVTGLCEWNSPVTGEFPAQRASNAEIFPLNDVIMAMAELGSSQWQEA